MSTFNKVKDEQMAKLKSFLSAFNQSKLTIEEEFSIARLQKVLTSENKNASEELHDYLAEHYANSEKHIEGIKENIIEYNSKYRSISKKGNNIIKAKILSLIESINLISNTKCNENTIQ